MCDVCFDVLQEMMMEIMDKYVQAGEALAEKENDLRHLNKQVRMIPRYQAYVIRCLYMSTL